MLLWDVYEQHPFVKYGLLPLGAYCADCMVTANERFRAIEDRRTGQMDEGDF